MNIITALSNTELHEELKKVNEFNILSKDIQYQEGVIETLKEIHKVDILIMSETIPGELNIYEFINKIKKENKNLKIIIFLKEKKEELEIFLYSKGIHDIYYDNKININEFIKNIKEKNKINKIENKIQKINDNKLFQIIRIIKKLKNKNKKNKIISIIGTHGSGKSVFSINLVKSIKNKKVLLIDFDIINNSIHTLLGVKKYPVNINKEKIEINDLIIKINNNINLICGLDLIYKKNQKIKEEEIKNIFTKLNNIYDYIIVDTSSECFFDYTKFIIRNSDISLFLVESNLIEIEKSKKLLDMYIKNWNIKKEKIKIIMNKQNKNSIYKKILKNIFTDFNIIGEIKYSENYNTLINKNFNYYMNNKIKREFLNVIKIIQ